RIPTGLRTAYLSPRGDGRESRSYGQPTSTAGLIRGGVDEVGGGMSGEDLSRWRWYSILRTSWYGSKGFVTKSSAPARAISSASSNASAVTTRTGISGAWRLNSSTRRNPDTEG